MELTARQAALAALAATPGVGPATIRALSAAAEANGIALLAAAALPQEHLARAGCPPAGIRALQQAVPPDPDRLLDQLGSLGARPAFAGLPPYPEALVHCLDQDAPPVVFLGGNDALLQRRAVGMVGTREPSPAARSACRRLAQDLAEAGVTPVSGGARGIDTAAHMGGLAGGAVVVVPPVGLSGFRWRGVRGVPRPGAWCIVSQFGPDAGWRDEQALIRNRTIVALSEAVVAFEPRDRGGTWHSCHQALVMRKPLFVVSAVAAPAQRRALKHLVQRGAVALEPDHMPSPEELLRLAAEHTPPGPPAQAGLF